MRIFAALAALMLIVSACSSDTESSEEPTTDATEEPTTDATEEPTTDATEEPTAEPTDVAADPSLDPVNVGWHNLEGGAAFSLPDVREGFEAGVDYVNERLGGINGRPLEYTRCDTDVTPESTLNCANRFVDEGVVMAVQGVDFVNDASLPVLQEAGILDVVSFALGAATNAAAGDVIASTLSNEEGYAASLVIQQELGAESLAYVLADQPANRAVASDLIAPAAETLGLDVETYFYGQPADWTTLATTVVAGGPDAITLFGTDPDCLAAVPAFRDAGFEGTIHAGNCFSIVDELGVDAVADVIYGITLLTPAVSGVSDKVANELAIFGEYIADHPDVTDIGQALSGFHVAVLAADILRQVPGDEITSETVSAIASTVSGDLFFKDTGYDCSTPTWPGTSACGSGMIFLTYDETGALVQLPNQPVDVSSAIG